MPLASLIPNWFFLIKNTSALFLPENPSSLHKGLWKSHHCEMSQSRAGQAGERNIAISEKKLLQLGHHHLKNTSVRPIERAARLQCLGAKLSLQPSIFYLCFCLCLYGCGLAAEFHCSWGNGVKTGDLAPPPSGIMWGLAHL